MYTKPLLSVDLLLDEDYNALLNYSLETGLIHKLLNVYTNQILPKPDLILSENPPHVNPGDMVYLKELEVRYSRKPKSKMERPISGHTRYSHCSKTRRTLFMGSYI